MNKLFELLKIITILFVYFLSLVISFLYINTAWGQTAFVSLILIGFTYYFTSNILEYNKKCKWEQIQEKVNSELNEIFNSVLGIISLLCFDYIEPSFAKPPTLEDIQKIVGEHRLKQLKKIYDEKNIKIKEPWRTNVITGLFRDSFNRREKAFNDFQIKYHIYLDADVIISLIDIQKAFHVIAQEINTRDNRLKNTFLKLSYNDEEGLRIIENNLQKIVEGIQLIVDKGILK